ncbi:hypothetical protein ABZX44_35130, partial [Streptomyces antibioticus]
VLPSCADAATITRTGTLFDHTRSRPECGWLLNPVEGVWAHLKKSLANLAPRTIDDLTPLVKNRLRGIQRRSEILEDR